MRRKNLWKYLISACMAVILPFCNFITGYGATKLPDGVAVGLPEKFTIMDSDGNCADSSTGDYFLNIEDMTQGEQYTKTIQVMNLREDKAYHIYLYAQPVDAQGEINLEEECDASFRLNGRIIYTGKVDGDGTPNMQEEPIDLGLYEPGESNTLTYSVVWNGTDAGGDIDYGSRIVDKDGVTVVRDKSGQEQISGEVTFRWVFYAVLDETYVPPKTGILGGTGWILALVLLIVLALILCLLILIYKKRGRIHVSEKN
jgi:hypothetical protein